MMRTLSDSRKTDECRLSDFAQNERRDVSSLRLIIKYFNL